VVICTACIGSYNSNYHTITTTTTRVLWKVALNTKTQTLYDYIIHRCKKIRRLWIKYFTVGIMFQYGKCINWCSIRLLLIIFWKSVTFMINESLYYIKIESINIHFSASLFLDFFSLTPMHRRSVQRHIEIEIFIALIAYSWKANQYVYYFSSICW
jgi:hypothetical protein